MVGLDGCWSSNNSYDKTLFRSSLGFSKRCFVLLNGKLKKIIISQERVSFVRVLPLERGRRRKSAISQPTLPSNYSSLSYLFLLYPASSLYSGCFFKYGSLSPQIVQSHRQPSTQVVLRTSLACSNSMDAKSTLHKAGIMSVNPNCLANSATGHAVNS